MSNEGWRSSENLRKTFLSIESNIYIQLLEEGTKVYRPVPARSIGNNTYEVAGREIYDHDDEVWQFTPGSLVLVEKRSVDGITILVAIKELGVEN